MTLDEFNSLPYRRQLELMLLEATYLANRWDREQSVDLYHLGRPNQGFFIELPHTRRREDSRRLRGFRQCSFLEAYAAYVQLPDL